MDVKIFAKGNPIVVERGAVYVENATQNNYYPTSPQPDPTAEADTTDDNMANEWARRYFDELSTIYPSWQSLATKAANVRSLYLEATRKNEGRARWRTQCIRELFFPLQKDKQWLKDTDISLEAIKALLADEKITKDTLTDAKNGYKYLGK